MYNSMHYLLQLYPKHLFYFRLQPFTNAYGKDMIYLVCNTKKMLSR